MSAYIETLALMDNGVATDASDEKVWKDYAEGASRLFDLLCGVEENFFAKGESTASEKSFFGNGIDMLRLPPFVKDSITGILIDDEEIEADDYRLRAQYVIDRRGDSVFDEDEEIKITAKWGFEKIPAEVKTVVTELANYLWRQRDPMFAKMSDVEIEQDLSPTVKAIVKRFRDKYSTEDAV